MLKKIILSLVSILYVLGATSQSVGLKSIDEFIWDNYPSLDKLYKYLHQHPELSMQEKNTSGLMTGHLQELGFEVMENFGAYNLAGVLKNGPGPVVLIRTDMDALPVREQTNLPYASTAIGVTPAGDEVGVMHACGHDIHMTVFSGVAKMLSEHRDQWQGTLVMVAQSAEETGLGAHLFFENRLYEKTPAPDYALALHCNPYLEAGKVGYHSGPMLASVDMIDIIVHGEGGHGAAPHTTKDPVVLSAQLIESFQTIVSREINPQEPAVVTVGSIKGGTVHNVIPDKVHLQLTVRSYSTEVRDQIIEGIKRRCRYLGLASGLNEDQLPEISIREPYTPTTVNDPDLIERMVIVFEKEIGTENVQEMHKYTFGEDFSLYGIQDHKVPICMFWLGTVDPVKVKSAKDKNEQLPSLHSSLFAPLPEPTIKAGVKAMVVAAFELFNN